MDLYYKLKNEVMEELATNYAIGGKNLEDLFEMIEESKINRHFKNKFDEEYTTLSIQLSLIDQLVLLKKVKENKEERMKIGAKLIEIGKKLMEE